MTRSYLKGMFTALTAAALLWSSMADAKEVVYNWKLVSVLGNEYSPDCENVQQDRRWLYLAQPMDESGNPLGPPTMPGPLVEATEGDTIVIKITNAHPTLGVTIHFHGIHQIGTPWSDGPAHITQCPLGSGETQELRFKAYPPGTHYWHAHNGMELVDGLVGAVVVKPQVPEPFEYDEDQVLFLQDFFSQTGDQQQAGLDNYPFTWIGNPMSLLINGKGLAADCAPGGSLAADASACLSTCNDTLAWIPTLDVQANMTYRFRLINSAQLTMQNFAIAGHEMSIVEVVATIVDPPITVTDYDIAPGQRVSVLVTMDQAPGDYLLETTVRARNITGLTGRAVIHYNETGLPVTLPSETPYHPAWDDFELAKAVEDGLLTMNTSMYPESVALTATQVEQWVIVGTQNTKVDANGNVIQLRWAVNNISDVFMAPEPLMARALRLSRELGWPADLGEGVIDMPKMPPFTWNYTASLTDPGGPGGNLGQTGTTVIRLSKGQVFDIVLQNALALNGAAEFHPWHVHGNSFWVVGRGEGIFNPDTDPANYNLQNPLLRDTATLWPTGWTALRLVANNPGVWFFHCHLASHMAMGMSFALVVEPDMIGDPTPTVPLCGSYAATNSQVNSSHNTTEEGGDSGSSSLLGGTAFTMLLALILALSYW